MLGVNEHMDLKLPGREIIFEEFERILTRYPIVTDRRLTVASPRSTLASRGKNAGPNTVIVLAYQIETQLVEP